MRIALLIILMFLAWGCKEKAFFHEHVELTGSTWTYQDSIQFDIAVEDTLGSYEMQLDIEHADFYTYQNIYLKIITEFPGGNRTLEQLSIDLAEKSGKWLGNCKGNKCRIKVFLLESFRFPEQGDYKFIISQHTRTEQLEGIEQIGLSVFKMN